MIRKTHGALLIPVLVLSTGLLCAQSDNTPFQDVQPSGTPDSSFFPFIQLAKRLGLAVASAVAPCTANLPPGANPPVLLPPGSGGIPSSQSGCLLFGPDTVITRAETAYWVVRAQMDETQISSYLCSTGGDPSGLTPQCDNSLSSSSFGDLGVAGASIVNPFLGPTPALGVVGVSNAQLMRYIIVMVRRGYTKGCGTTNDAVLQFCPNDPVSRAEMSVFVIRAKENNVFPTSLSGATLSAPFGDNFAVPTTPYFTDVQPNDPVWGPYFIFVQAMRELGITLGTSPTTFSPGNNVTRKEIATFVVRAFFT